ncbi:MAG: hypothetical protein ACE5OS_05725 [Anaerolineae bacterium]
MSSTATLEAISPAQVLERLSVGEPIHGIQVTGLLDLDPLIVSRWLCGEDMRGIYQPIFLHHCVLDGLDLEGRTFYELVELVGCRVTAAHFARAYFYSGVLIEECVFEGDFHGRGIQNDGRMVVHNTVFTGWAEFGGIGLRGQVNLVDVSFPGGTNLLHVLADGSRGRLGREIRFSGCRFRSADVPAGLEAAQLGIAPLVEGDLRSAEG